MDIIEATNMMRRLECLPDIHKAEDVAIIRMLHAYFNELYAVELEDKAYADKGVEDEAYEQQSLDKKTEIHEKYWSNQSEFYQPCTIMSQPRHNWDHISHINILRNNDEDNELFIFIAKYRESKGKSASDIGYLLAFVDDQLMIEHKFI